MAAHSDAAPQGHANNTSRLRPPLQLLTAAFIALGTSLLLSLWAHAVVCMGLHPEAMYTANTAIPLLALLCGGAWIGSRSRRGWPGGAMLSLLAILFWFLMWGYLVARFEISLWWPEAVGGLTVIHAVAWGYAIIAGAFGGALGAWLRNKDKRFGFSLAILVFLLLPACMLGGLALRQEYLSGRVVQLSPGASIRTTPPDADGTVLRLLSFDLSKEPQLEFGIYDADSDDAIPFDDRNTNWLGQSLEFVSARLQRRLRSEGQELRCLINAGFFGADGPWVAFHEAPIVIRGKSLYNTRILKEDWPDQAWVFSIFYGKEHPHFSLEADVSWQELNRPIRTAFAGVRPLRVHNQSRILKPGMGNTTLRCSRTSIGWSEDSRKFYVLTVRDPDGEAASLQQKKRGVQIGGWDVRQVQQFWERMKVPNAVLFDGGESTELTYGTASGHYPMVHCAYHVSKTLGYWRNRPLRVFLPMLPAAPNQGGVLNYLYLHGPRRH